jgi:exosortase
MNLGTRYLMALSLPLAYLILMVPIFDEAIEKIHWPFQIVTAVVSSELLTILGVPLIRNAQYIQLPNITMEVAEVCSGIRYLVSIIAIAVPLAYFTQKGWWRKVVLIISAIVIGIVTNWMRVTFIGIWVYYSGGSNIHGPLHIFQGVFVSVAGFILLFIFAWLLSKAHFTSKEKG